MKTTTQKETAVVWDLPEDWHPELSKGARKLYGRLMSLTSTGTKSCTYTSAQAKKELDISPASVKRFMAELRAAGLVTSGRASNSFGPNVRTIELVADKAPAVGSKHGSTVGSNGSTVGSKHGSNEPIMSHSIGSKHGSKISQLSHIKSAVRLEYMQAEGDFAPLIIKNIKNIYIRSAVALECTPQLLSGLVDFNFSNLKGAFKFPFTPWGQRHSGVFNFGGLWDLCTYPDPDSLMDVNPKSWWCFHKDEDPAKDKDKHWRQFFIMTALLELSCYSDQMFRNVHLYKKNGEDFYNFYFDQQYGMAFTIINSAYPVDAENEARGELEGHAVYRTIMNKFEVGKGDLLKFACGFVLREALNIINDPELCEKAYLGWRSKFYRTMAKSFPSALVTNNHPNDPLYGDGYFSPDLARRLLNDELGIVPRFIFPTLMFRRLVTINLASGLAEDGPCDTTNIRAINFIKFLRDGDKVRKQWDYLCEHMADKFPFMTKQGVFEHV